MIIPNSTLQRDVSSTVEVSEPEMKEKKKEVFWQRSYNDATTNRERGGLPVSVEPFRNVHHGHPSQRNLFSSKLTAWEPVPFQDRPGIRLKKHRLIIGLNHQHGMSELSTP